MIYDLSLVVEEWGHRSSVGRESVGDGRGSLGSWGWESPDSGGRSSSSFSNTESNIDATQDNIRVGFPVEESLGFIVSLKMK